MSTAAVRSVVAASLIALLSTACTPTVNVPSPSPTDEALDKVDLPPGTYIHVAWPWPDEVLVQQEPAEQESIDHTPWPDRQVIWRITISSGERRELRVPFDGECHQLHYFVMTRLPDGRLGMERTCLLTPLGQHRITLIAFDATTGSVEELVEVPRSIDSFTWNPQMSEGYWSGGSLICHGIRRMDRSSGSLEAPIFVGEGEQRFRIDQYFEEPDPDNCDHIGRAIMPAWSPDGATIAFLASPSSVGTPDFDRLDEPWELYLMEAATLEPVRHMIGIFEPRQLAWSPDGRFLAMPARLEDEGLGTWLYEPVAGRLIEASPVRLAMAAWSPDGTHLLGHVLLPGGEGLPKSEVFVLDITEIVATQ